MPRGRPWLGLIGLGLVGAAGVVVATARPDQSAIPAASRVPATVAAADPSVSAEAAQVAVVDGGTLRLRDRVVRLFGVTAPERGAPCKDSRGGQLDCGAEATNALAGLVRSQPVACQVEGSDRLGRAVALCAVGGHDISLALVEGGYARANGGSPSLKTAESAARAGRRGLWDANASW